LPGNDVRSLRRLKPCLLAIIAVEITGVIVFVLAVLMSFAASWLLASRLERLGERLGVSEAVSGMAVSLVPGPTPGREDSSVTSLTRCEVAH
jgi:hypothetical protein